ncbi:MAG: NAD-dependent epimerase/dehydratase family protein [Vulcanimicrobiaceae bacterium]|jgi:nucleoside-diphosphate-sugar epimerase
MRVFITGASGYIGTAVCAAVKKRGHDVVGLARSANSIEKLKAAGVHPVLGTLSDHNVLREMTHDADAVIHCAFEQSAEGVALETGVLDAMLGAVDTDHEAFIYTSGVWVYGDTGGKTIDETAPLNPIPLVAWRPAIERKVQDAQRHKLRTIVIRPGLVYGGSGGLVGMMMGLAKAQQLVIIGSGKNHWQMVNVNALGELYALAIERAPADSIYNGVSSDSAAYGEIVRAVHRAAGGDGNVHAVSLDEGRKMMGPFADALALDQRISGAKAARELEWDAERPGVLEELSASV